MKKILEKIAGYAIWGLIILLTISVFRNLGRSSQIKDQIQAEKAKLAKIQAENDTLLSELAQAQNPNFIEKEIRNKLGLGREGEATVVLPDTETLKKLAPKIPSQVDTLPDPNWIKWKKLFF
jgi:cell division protein FtsB